jgi:hypothetical protein
VSIVCVGGPIDGKPVSEKMGERWPYVIANDRETAAIGGHYVLRDGEYIWEPGLEEVKFGE